MAVSTNDQRMILEMVRQVSRDVLWEQSPHYDQSGEFPWPQLKQLGQLGLLGMTTPEEWGGAGLDSVTWAMAMEEIAAADPSVAVILSVTSGLPQYMLSKFGTLEQKKKYLVPLASGEWIGAFCLTEPHAGSDPSMMKLQAKRVAGGWQLDGVKSWVTSGGQAQVYTVMAKGLSDQGEAGISSFLVDKDTPGLSFGRPEDKMGLHAAHTCEVHFDGVVVAESSLLGTEGRGLAQALAGLDSGRVGIAAQAVGIARGAFEIARRYADERVQFGQKIREHQAIGFKLAEMHSKIAAARALTLEAAAKKDLGQRFSLEASTAKLVASDAAVSVTRDAVQILGGYGCHRDYRVERYYRDAKITEIYEGTSEIQKMVIARELYR